MFAESFKTFIFQKFRRPLCHKVNLPSCVARRPLCHKVNLQSCVARRPLCHKVNLPRCEARRRHLIMTCDIFGTGQTNTLTLCYLLGKTYKPAHSSATLKSLKSTHSTKLLEKLLTWAAHAFCWRLWWFPWNVSEPVFKYNSLCPGVHQPRLQGAFPWL